MQSNTPLLANFLTQSGVFLDFLSLIMNQAKVSNKLRYTDYIRQVILATALDIIRYYRSDSLGDKPSLMS